MAPDSTVSLVAACDQQQASGSDLERFSEQYLFSPMGIVDFEWPHNGTRDLIVETIMQHIVPAMAP